MIDSERPPAVAHQRFAANRTRFEHMDLTQRFASIQANNLWGADTSVSGLGSETKATLSLRRQLPALLRTLGVRTLLDAPCGDVAWISNLDLGNIRYIGVDIVPALIEKNKAEHPALGTFALADITGDPLPSTDAILCRDCLVHISFANIVRAIDNFRRSGARWLVTTTFPAWQQNIDCDDSDWRALNMTRPPFAWPAPVKLLDEGCDEAVAGGETKALPSGTFGTRQRAERVISSVLASVIDVWAADRDTRCGTVTTLSTRGERHDSFPGNREGEIA